MGFKKTETHEIKIFIAGDINTIKQVVHKYCRDTGFCVTVTPTTYIYTGGEETGVILGIINYARFPTTPKCLFAKAYKLAIQIRYEANQSNFTIMTPTRTWWFCNSNRT